MRHSFAGLLFALSLVVLLTAPAAAASVHLKGGKNAEPSFTDNGLTLSVSGELAGLGEGDVLITLLATGDPTATCQNPGSGEHFPPGQNPAPVTLTGTEAIPESEIKNGTTPFGPIETEAPESPVTEAPDCPNTQWIEEITDVSFTSATIIVEQPEGTVVLTVECTFDPATSDGEVPASDVECTSS
jgi:hypothetical protein